MGANSRLSVLSSGVKPWLIAIFYVRTVTTVTTPVGCTAACGAAMNPKNRKITCTTPLRKSRTFASGNVGEDAVAGGMPKLEEARQSPVN